MDFLNNKKQFKIKAKNKKKNEKFHLEAPWTTGTRALDFKSSPNKYEHLQFAKLKYQDIDLKEVVFDQLSTKSTSLILQFKMIDFITNNFWERNKFKAAVIFRFIINKFK